MALRTLVVSLLLLASAAAGSTIWRQDVQTDVANQSAPATLAAGDTGTTTIGTSLASADTSVGALTIALPQNVLDIDRDTSDWTVRVEAQSISGFGVLDAATVSLTDGVTPELQVDIVAGVLSQTTGNTLSLLPSQTTLEITASAAKSSLDDNVITMEIVLTGSGGSPELRYPYTLTIT